MPVLSSTVHIDRHAELRWLQTIFRFLLTHLCTVMFCGRPPGWHIGGIFWYQGMPRTSPLRPPERKTQRQVSR